MKHRNAAVWEWAIWALAALCVLLLADRSPGQCPSPLLYEFGGGTIGICNSTSGVQALGNGRKVQMVQTNLSPPVLGGSVTLDYQVSAMHAYFVGQVWALDGLSLYGLNTSDPANPQITGRLQLSQSEYLFTLRVTPNAAYVLTRNTLHIVDITNPAAPVLRSTFAPVGGDLEDIEVIGNYAYCAVSSYPAATFLVIDVSNPAQPVQVARVAGTRSFKLTKTPGNSSLFVRTISSEGTVRIERWLPSPTIPVMQAMSAPLQSDSQGDLKSTFNAVCELFYDNAGAKRIRVLDPVSLAEQATAPVSAGARMTFEWPYAYVGKWTGGMHRVSIQDAAGPQVSTNYVDLPPGALEGMGATNSGFSVMCGGGDVWFYSTPASGPPTPLLHIIAPGDTPYEKVVTQGDMSFLMRLNSVPGTTTIEAYRYTPAPPTQTFAGFITIPGLAITMDIGGDASAPRRLYVTTGTNMSATLRIINASNPAAMSLTSSTPLLPGINYPAKFLAGSPLLGLPERLLVGGDAQTQILSVVTAAAPTTLGVIPEGAYTLGASFGTTVWLMRSDEVHAYSIATPSAPVPLGTVRLGNLGLTFCFISPFADRLAVTRYDGRLVTVNTSNPSALSLVQIADLRTWSQEVAFDGERLHMASDGEGYRVIQAYFSASPAEDPNALLGPSRICLGSSLTLHAGVVASPAVSSYTWFKNGVALANGPTGHGSSYSGVSTATLVVQTPSGADVGLFTCEAANTCGTVTVSSSVSFCYANCDCSGTAPILNVNDFTCFLNKYASGDPIANCDGSTLAPVLNVNDFTCFLNKYAAGCP